MDLHPKWEPDFQAPPCPVAPHAASASQDRELQLICRPLDDSKLTLNELFKDLYVQVAAPHFGPASQPGAAEMALIGAGWTRVGRLL